jgi:hypothetical protein
MSISRQLSAFDGVTRTLRYLSFTPRRLPRAGRVIVHNAVHAIAENQPPGMNGFRVWTAAPGDLGDAKRCTCGWSGLPHYRMPRMAGFRRPKPPSVKGKQLPSDQVEAHDTMTRQFGPRLA